MKNKKISKIITILCIILLPMFLYYLLISDSGAANFFSVFKQLRYRWLVLACFLMLLSWLLESLVLDIMCRFLDNKVKFRMSFKTTMVGQFFNSVTPFATGGQPMQLYYLVQGEKMNTGTASSALMLKFVIYQFILTAYSLVVIIFKFNYFANHILQFAFLALIGFVVNTSVIAMCIIFTQNKKLARRIIYRVLKIFKFFHIVKDIESAEAKAEVEIQKFHEGYLLIRGKKRIWFSAGIITFLQLTAFYLITYCIYRSFELSGNLVNIVSAQSFVQMVTSFVPIPGASGAAEGSFYLVFQIFFAKEAIAVVVLIWRLITYYSCIVFGGLVMVFPMIKNFVFRLFRFRKKNKNV